MTAVWGMACEELLMMRFRGIRGINKLPVQSTALP